MIRSYYYLMAQLPSIVQIDQKGADFMSFSEFKDLAERYLSEKDFAILNTVTLNPPRTKNMTGSAFLDSWYDFERALRLALEQIRAAKLKWEHDTSYDERNLLSDAFLPRQIASEAITMQNPLDAELFLDAARFKAVDSISRLENFSNISVFSYAIKLLLCERFRKFNIEKGRQEYSKTYHAILEDTHT